MNSETTELEHRVITFISKLFEHIAEGEHGTIIALIESENLTEYLFTASPKVPKSLFSREMIQALSDNPSTLPKIMFFGLYSKDQDFLKEFLIVVTKKYDDNIMKFLEDNNAKPRFAKLCIEHPDLVCNRFFWAMGKRFQENIDGENFFEKILLQEVIKSKKYSLSELSDLFTQDAGDMASLLFAAAGSDVELNKLVSDIVESEERKHLLGGVLSQLQNKNAVHSV